MTAPALTPAVPPGAAPFVSPVVFAPAEFDAVFPFHVAADREGRVTRVGRAWHRLSPGLAPGVALGQRFSRAKTGAPLEWAEGDAAAGRGCLICEHASGLVLRGQVQRMGPEWFFLGSPWLAESPALPAAGLTPEDFSAHDATPELVQAWQAQRTAAAETARLAAQLELQRADHEQAVRLKGSFLARMSHELRTPLTGILGLTETLIEGVAGPLNEKQVRHLQIVSGSGRRLLAVVNDILDLARIESGEAQLAKFDCLPEEICAASVEDVRVRAAKRGQRLSFECDARGLRLHLDGRRIKQALDNLLENAAKFTPKDGEFGLRLRTGRGELRIEVWDRGIGIAADDLPRLFKPFMQVDDRIARRYDGTGLGLALVKLIVELHDGRVEVTSACGAGSCFTVILPWAGTMPAATSAACGAAE